MQKLLKLFNGNMGKYLLTAILLVVPLFPKFPAFRIPGTYVAVRLEDFLILFTLLFFAIPILQNIKSIFKNNISRSILIFLGIGLISLISGIYLTQTVDLKIGLLHWFRRVEYLSLFFVSFVYVRSNKDNNLFFDYAIKILLIFIIYCQLNPEPLGQSELH